MPLPSSNVRPLAEEAASRPNGPTRKGTRSCDLEKLASSLFIQSHHMPPRRNDLSIELNAGQQVSAAELIARCKEKLGSVKAPKSVDFVESLPRSPVGKVLKKDLRARYWQNTARKI